jgi:hypothetical protein
LLLLLIISAPARLLGLLVPSDVLVMQGLDGSLWRGSAARCLVAAGHGYIHLGSVKWRLSPLSLLTLSPTVELESRWGKQQISGRITLRDAENFDVRELEASVSAQLLRQFAPFLIDGNFSVDLASLTFRDGLPYSGKGRVLWRDAAWLSPQGPRALGDYALDFEQPEELALVGEIVTITGPVGASGDIQLAGRSYTVDILLRSASGLDTQLQHAVSLFAQPVEGPDGVAYRIQLSGEL